MARLLVISRSMALAMRLGDAHEVTERSPANLEAIEPDGSIEVILIDVGEPAAAIRALDSLRSRGHVTPVLLVSGYQPAWAGLVAVDLPGVLVVPLPITKAALFEGIATLARTDPDPREFTGTAHSNSPTTAADPPTSEDALPEHAEPEDPTPEHAEPEHADPTPEHAEPEHADPTPEHAEPEHANPTPEPAPEDPRSDHAAPVDVEPEQARSTLAEVLPATEGPETLETAAARTEQPARVATATGSPVPANGSRTADVVLPVLQLPPPGQFTGFDWWGLPLAEGAAGSTSPSKGETRPPGAGAAGRAAGQAPAHQNASDSHVTGLSDLAEAQQVTLEQRRILLGRPRRGGAVSALRRRLGERAAQAAAATAQDRGGDASESPGGTPPAGLRQPRVEQAGNPFAAPPEVSATAPGQQADPSRSAPPATSGAAVQSPPPRPGRVAPQPKPTDERAHISPATPTTTPLPSIRAGQPGPGESADAQTARTRGDAAQQAPAQPARAQPTLERTSRPHPGAQQPREGPAGWTRALEAMVRIEQAAAAPVPAPIHDLRTLTLALSQRIEELYGVSDTAQVLADDVVERADADAAAVLVPDGVIWRVSGGVGLRPLERRLALDESHWLIENIAIAGQALMVEDTDIVRTRLAGAPLAAWRHLLAVPVPGIRAAVLLARGHEAAPFSEDDLNAVIGPAREAARLLQMALETRELARQLRPFAENDGLGR